MPLFRSVSDLVTGADMLRRHRYGIIDVADGQLRGVTLRPFPKIVSAPGVALVGRWRHRHVTGDHLRLFYNQTWRFPNFLVLKYIESARNTSYRTLVRALAVLDEIARLKKSDALLCDVSNRRISTRLMARHGWQPHCPSRFHRHYIKRFYGDYDSPASVPLSLPVPLLKPVSTT